MSGRKGERGQQGQPSDKSEPSERRRTGKSHVVLPQSSGTGATGAEFMSKQAPTLHSNLMRFGLSEHDAEDVVQEVFARALAYRPGFATARDFTRWATIVARNLGYDRLIALGRVQPGEVPDFALPDAAEEAERAADGKALVRAYESLSASDRRVLYEAADDLRPDTDPERERFRVWLSRARSRLRRRMYGWLIALPSRLRLTDVENLAAGFGGALVALAFAAGISASEPPITSRPPERMTLIGQVVVSSAVETSTPGPATPTPRDPAVTTDGGTEVVVSAGQTPTEERRLTYERVALTPPGGEQVAAVDAHESESPDPPLICVWNAPVVGSRCVAK